MCLWLKHAPAQHSHLPCRALQVIKTAPNYEVRQYTSGQKWVYTEVTGLLYSSAVSTGFKRLYQYTDGSNDKQIKVRHAALQSRA